MRTHPAKSQAVWVVIVANPIANHMKLLVDISAIDEVTIGEVGSRFFKRLYDMRNRLVTGERVIRIEDADNITRSHFDALIDRFINAAVFLGDKPHVIMAIGIIVDNRHSGI